jgi:hypothetical protein
MRTTCTQSVFVLGANAIWRSSETCLSVRVEFINSIEKRLVFDAREVVWLFRNTREEALV